MGLIIATPWVAETDTEELYIETEEQLLDLLYDCEETIHSVKRLVVTAIEEYEVIEEEDEFGDVEYKLGKRKE